jgi:DNA-binding MarR family transcriptional regulator
MYLIAEAYHALRAQFDTVLKPYGLTSVQFALLDLLSVVVGMSSAELSRHFFVTPQTMGEMIASLERRGLVSRTLDSANKRIRRVSLTREGARLLQRCNREIDPVEVAAFGKYSAGEHDRLRDMLQEIKAEMRSAQTQEPAPEPEAPASQRRAAS